MNAILPLIIFRMHNVSFAYPTSKLITKHIQRLMSSVISRLHLYRTYLVPHRSQKVYFIQMIRRIPLHRVIEQVIPLGNKHLGYDIFIDVT